MPDHLYGTGHMFLSCAGIAGKDLWSVSGPGSSQCNQLDCTSSWAKKRTNPTTQSLMEDCIFRDDMASRSACIQVILY